MLITVKSYTVFCGGLRGGSNCITPVAPGYCADREEALALLKSFIGNGVEIPTGRAADLQYWQFMCAARGSNQGYHIFSNSFVGSALPVSCASSTAQRTLKGHIGERLTCTYTVTRRRLYAFFCPPLE